MIRPLTLAGLLALGLASTSLAQISYFSSFETDGGGWTGTNDWQRGIPMGFVGGFSSTEPVGGHTGDYVWGTIIGGDHSPSTTSVLSQTFDLSGSMATTMSFYEWSDSGGNSFDMARVTVNGTQEYLSDGNSMDAWRLVTLDLSAYDGLSSVNVAFEFSTTTVVERTGWYIDDVALRAVPEPTGLLGMLAGLAMLALRRR